MTAPPSDETSTTPPQPTQFEDQWPRYNGYQPLNGGRREIRLLHLHNAKPSEAMTADLRHVSLDDNLEYFALSYYWGAPVLAEDLLPILLDGSEVLVRPTLMSFLRNLVHQIGHAIVWLDALCINQRDPQEKMEQVRMMGTIYSNAKRTYAWLGDGNSDTDYVCRAFQQPNGPDFLTRDFDIYFRQIMQRPYWDRAWIVQEYALSKDVILVIGKYSLAADTFFEHRPPSMLRMARLSSLDGVKKAVNCKEHSYGSVKSLVKLMFMFRESACSDARDKLYSLLSLVQTDLSPDYTLPAFELVFQVTKAINDLLQSRFEKDYRQMAFVRDPDLLRLFQLLTICIQPSIEDLLSTFRLSSRLSLTTEALGYARVRRCPLENRNSQSRTLQCYFHASSVKGLSDAHLFRLAWNGPLSQLLIAVNESPERTQLVGVGFYTRKIQFVESENTQDGRLTAGDLCLLSDLVCHGVRPCQIESADNMAANFHISKLVLVLMSLGGGIDKNQAERRERTTTLSRILHDFLVRLESAGLHHKEPVLSDCQHARAKLPHSTKPDVAFSAWMSSLSIGDRPRWKRETRLRDATPWALLRERSRLLCQADDEQTLAECGFVKCDLKVTLSVEPWQHLSLRVEHPPEFLDLDPDEIQ